MDTPSLSHLDSPPSVRTGTCAREFARPDGRLGGVENVEGALRKQGILLATETIFVAGEGPKTSSRSKDSVRSALANGTSTPDLRRSTLSDLVGRGQRSRREPVHPT